MPISSLPGSARAPGAPATPSARVTSSPASTIAALGPRTANFEPDVTVESPTQPSALGTNSSHWGATAVAAGAMLACSRSQGMRRQRPSRRRATLALPLRGTRIAAASGTEAVVEKDSKIISPDLDKKQYRHIVLPNGLSVLLASDPDADAAGASMSIWAGSFQDPPEYLGLAHFHEHMLFLGTEKYPDEDEYERYLKDNGGYSNAYTADEVTNYFFRVNAPYLKGGLDRFSQFFIAPTFAPSAVDREMKAVDSESTNYSADEGWRRLQVMKTTAQESHPFNRFSVGNLSTLGHSGPETVREVLLEWNSQTYHAGAMRLAVSGKETLDELEATVQELFGSIRASPPGASAATPVPLPPAPVSAPPPWTPSQLARYIEVVPKIDERSVSLFWPLPPSRKHMYAKIEAYLGHLLGHEGDGTLHALLNEANLIESLSAGAGYSFSNAQLFAVEIQLTLEGERRLAEVLERVYAYIAILQEAGPRAETFEELRLLSEVGFRFQEESPAPENFCASASTSLQFYPPEDALRGPSAWKEWLPDEVASWLGQLRPELCLVVRASQDFQDDLESQESNIENTVSAWVQEKWYGAPFRQRPLTEEERASWSAPCPAAREGLRVPEDNPFVPSDFALRCDAPGADPAETQPKTPLDVLPPKNISIPENTLVKLWHKTDSIFRVPRAYINAHIMTPVYKMGPRAVVMLRLFCELLQDDLNTYSYSAATAGISYNFSFSDRLTFAVGGFNHKLPVLLERVASRLRSLLEELAAAAGPDGTPEQRLRWATRVEKMREFLLRDYENFFRDNPSSVADYHMRLMLISNMWHLSEYMEVLRSGDGAALLQPLVEDVCAAFSKMRIELIAHGNLSSEEAIASAELLQRSLTSGEGDNTLPASDVLENEVVLLPPQPQHVEVFEYDLEETNPLEENSAILNVYQVGPFFQDTHRDMCLTMTAHLADTSAFTQLRTQEQLGYVVNAGYHRVYDVDGLSVIVQGPRLPPAGMDARIEAWLTKFRGELEDMSEDEFATNVRAIADLKRSRDKMLVQETGRYWGEIMKRTYRFDRLEKELATLEQLTKADVVAFFDDYIAAGAQNRRKLSSRVIGATARREQQDEEQQALKAAEEQGIHMHRLATLEDARNFKQGLPTYRVG